jgi:hypothetical protein
MMRQAIATVQPRCTAAFRNKMCCPPPLLRAVRAFSDGAEKSLHSKDIAFKPNQDGWGFTNRYSGACVCKRVAHGCAEPAPVFGVLFSRCAD